MTITIKKEGLVSTVILDEPPQNLMTIAFMDELVEAHKEADAHPDTRVIITASAVPGMFSNGLDPAYVLERSKRERVPIFRAVGRMLHGLFSLGKPHIAKITGPAMAGGAILAITADFRFFETEQGRMSFSEPKVGLPIPESVAVVIRHFCNPAYLREVVLLARNMDAAFAVASGMADGAAPADKLEEMVYKQAERLARLSPSIMKTTKRGLRREILPRTEAFQHGDPAFDQFVGDQFLGEGLTALVENRFPRFQS